MIPVPSHELIRFLSWLHVRGFRLDTERNSERLRELAFEFLQRFGHWAFDSLANVMVVFQECPMIGEPDVEAQMDHFSSCGSCIEYIPGSPRQRGLLLDERRTRFVGWPRLDEGTLHPLLQGFVAWARGSELEAKLGAMRHQELERPNPSPYEFRDLIFGIGSQLREQFRRYISEARERDPSLVEKYLHSQLRRGGMEPGLPERRRVLDESTQPLGANESIDQAARRLAASVRLAIASGYYDQRMAEEPRFARLLSSLRIESTGPERRGLDVDQPLEAATAKATEEALMWPAPPPPRGDRAAPLHPPPGGEGGDAAGGDGSFYWNTCFPQDASVSKARILVIDLPYLVETAIETSPSTCGLPAPAVEKERLPQGISVVFELRAKGAVIRAGDADLESDQVRSPPLEVGPQGTAPFRATLTAKMKTVALEMTLFVGNALIAHQTIGFRGVTPCDDAGPPAPAVLPPEPPTASPRVAAGALSTQTPVVRLDVEARDGKFWLRPEGGVLTGRWIQAHSSVRELADEAIRLRTELVALSDKYDPDPAVDFGIRAPADALLNFARIGGKMHAAFFGDPRDPNVSADLRRVAASLAVAGRGSEAARMQIVAENLPFPWAVMYDGLDRGKPSPANAGDVDLTCFWGTRFRIDRRVIGNVGDAPSPVIGRTGLRAQSCLNPHIDEEQGVAVVDRQRALFDEIKGANSSLTVLPRIESREAFEAWLAGEQACEILYFFCHAHAAQTLTEIFFNASLAPNVQATITLGERTEDGVNIAEMWNLHPRPLNGEPLVFMNACSTATGDHAFQSLFLRHFVASWRARGFLGTDWKVPTLFADEFGRRVVEHFLNGRMTIADALAAAARSALDVGNPFPFVYALYAQPECRVL